MSSVFGILDDLIYTKEERRQDEILKELAKTPAQNNWIYIIPVVGLVIFGVLLAVVIKKRKKS